VRTCAPFQSDDLRELGRLLEQASAVVAMETIADGLADHAAIGMRHDVDNHIGPAVEMARWEAERGYRSTYFILPTAPYWAYKHELQAALEEIAGCGHEIGFHLNAITAAIQTGRDPFTILREQVEELRGYGYGCAASSRTETRRATGTGSSTTSCSSSLRGRIGVPLPARSAASRCGPCREARSGSTTTRTS
jgi:hypothetical protein